MAFITGPVPEAFEREVTATATEFERDLRKAWPAGVDMLEAGHFGLHEGAVRLAIRVESKGVRRLGLFELPVLIAHYRFSGGEEPDRKRLLSRLDRAMQKGGG